MTAPLQTRARDIDMMRRCIALASEAAKHGEFPFAALICDGDGEAVVEAANQVARSGDVTRHAELVAVSEAQQKLGRKNLSGCTLYTNVEPCPMCSFPIRETRISRVVYAISSPVMGGYSRWNVLRDTQICDTMPEAFGPVPEVIAGLCQAEAEQAWFRSKPLAWMVIRHRGCFGDATDPEVACDAMPAIAARGGWLRRLLTLHHYDRPRWRRRKSPR
jgi:tRNA(adenine34) deaminase